MTYHIYATETCSWCEKATALLDEHSESWVKEFINADAKVLKTLLGMAGLTTVPQIFAPDGTYIGGYEQLVAHLTPPVEAVE